MSDTTSKVARSGLIVSQKHRPGLFTELYKLYRNDIYFRSFCDMAMAGCLVLSFSAQWTASGPSQGASSSQPVSNVSSIAPTTSLHTQSESPIAREIAVSLGKIKVDRSAIATSGELVAGKLQLVVDALDRNDLGLAQELLVGLDDRNALTAYVKAAVIVQLPGLGKIAEAQNLLRVATRQGLFAAYVLYGQINFKMILADEQQTLPLSERVLVDDTGTSFPASRHELAVSANEWWQRAGAFSIPEGLRLAGFAKARGLGGKADYVAAAAMWKIAAEAGDPLSQYELGKLLLLGTGVQIDVKSAAQLFRKAKDKLPIAALTLAMSLMTESAAGNRDASAEGIEMAELASKNIEAQAERGMAHHVLAMYLNGIAVPALRDLNRAVDEFEKAHKHGYPESAYFAGLAYEQGLGKAKDLTCAYAFFKQSAAYFGVQDAAKRAASIEAQLDSNEKEKAARISFALAPKIGGNAQFSPIKPTITGNLDTIIEPQGSVWKSACLRAKSQ